MTPENFIYWLQGKLEIGNTKTLNEEEVQVIKDHIALVLKKETPVRQSVQLAQPITPPVDFTLKPRCEGGVGSCFRLGCKVCNGPLIATC